MERTGRSSVSEIKPPPNLRFTRHCVRVIGLVFLASASFSVAIGWLALGAHPLSGPVVLELAPEHGVHLTDPLALVPFALGVSCLWRARGVWIQRSESVS
jgi:hypothetical protein